MKKAKILLFNVFLLCILPVYAQDIRVMTYNIRLDVASDGINQWNNRRDFMAGQILFHEPGIMGIQEGLPHQVSWLDSVLSSYSYTGVGRDDGIYAGEYCAIFYRKDLFRLLSGSTFWLSETPEKPSLGWDAAIKRICTWAVLRHIESDNRILVMNTHFDHIGVNARNESAKLILQKIKELNPQNFPVIVMGDLNLEPESEAVQYISGYLNDSRRNSRLVFGPEGTFNGFNHDRPVTRRIDYIYTDKKKIRVGKYAVLSDSDECRYPSDHLPVFVSRRLR